MGCGSSSAKGAGVENAVALAEALRDPDDHAIEPLELQETCIEVRAGSEASGLGRGVGPTPGDPFRRAGPRALSVAPCSGPHNPHRYACVKGLIGRQQGVQQGRTRTRAVSSCAPPHTFLNGPTRGRGPCGQAAQLQPCIPPHGPPPVHPARSTHPFLCIHTQ